MAGTRVPGEGETPAETEQEMSLGRLQKRNSNPLRKVGGTYRLGAPHETPTPPSIGEDPVAIRAWHGPRRCWGRCGTVQGAGRHPASLVHGAFTAERGAGGNLP